MSSTASIQKQKKIYQGLQDDLERAKKRYLKDAENFEALRVAIHKVGESSPKVLVTKHIAVADAHGTVVTVLYHYCSLTMVNVLLTTIRP